MRKSSKRAGLEPPCICLTQLQSVQTCLGEMGGRKVRTQRHLEYCRMLPGRNTFRSHPPLPRAVPCPPGLIAPHQRDRRAGSGAGIHPTQSEGLSSGKATPEPKALSLAPRGAASVSVVTLPEDAVTCRSVLAGAHRALQWLKSALLLFCPRGHPAVR